MISMYCYLYCSNLGDILANTQTKDLDPKIINLAGAWLAGSQLPDIRQLATGRVNSLPFPIVSPSLSLVKSRLKRALTDDSKGDTMGKMKRIDW